MTPSINASRRRAGTNGIEKRARGGGINKKSRSSLTHGQKMNIIDKSLKLPHMSHTDLGIWAAKEFDLAMPVSRSTVQGILAKRDKIESVPETLIDLKRVRTEGPEVTAIEARLVQLIDEAARDSVAMNYRAVVFHARRISTKLGYAKPPIGFSEGWFYGFARRHGLSRRLMHGEAGSAPDLNEIEPEIEEIQEKLRGIPFSRVYNIDETGLFHSAAPRYTIAPNNKTGAGSDTRSYQVSGQRIDKTRITVCVIVNGDGSHFIDPVFIGKQQNKKKTHLASQPHI